MAIGSYRSKDIRYIPIAYRLDNLKVNCKLQNEKVQEAVETTSSSSYKKDCLTEKNMEKIVSVIWDKQKKEMKNFNSTSTKEVNEGLKCASGTGYGNKVAGQKESLIDNTSDSNYSWLLSNGSSIFGSVFSDDDSSIKSNREASNKIRKDLRPVVLSSAKKKKIQLCSMSLVFMTEYIGIVSNARVLQLCCNNFVRLPDEIGHLRNLRILSASNNLMQKIPDTIGYLENLTELRLSGNKILTIPRTIGFLKKLVKLHLCQNKIESLPQEIGYLKNLKIMHISNNALKCIPAEIKELEKLEVLEINGCPLYTPSTLPQNKDSKRVMSLKEITARYIVSKNIQVEYPNALPPTLTNYLESARYCSFCNRPFFKAHSIRYSFLKRDSIKIPLEYKLCSPHWHSEEERLIALFGKGPEEPLEISSNGPPPSLKREKLPEIDIPALKPCVWNKCFEIKNRRRKDFKSCFMLKVKSRSAKAKHG